MYERARKYSVSNFASYRFAFALLSELCLKNQRIKVEYDGIGRKVEIAFVKIKGIFERTGVFLMLVRNFTCSSTQKKYLNNTFCKNFEHHTIVQFIESLIIT